MWQLIFDAAHLFFALAGALLSAPIVIAAYSGRLCAWIPGADRDCELIYLHTAAYHAEAEGALNVADSNTEKLLGHYR